MASPRVLSVKSGGSFAGQRSVVAKVQYAGESAKLVTFVGPSSGAGPVVLITTNGAGRPVQTFVTDPSRFGAFGTAWARRFFA